MRRILLPSSFSKKHCKYFNMGEGTCPFGTSCFYRHGEWTGSLVSRVTVVPWLVLVEYPDGRKSEETPRFMEGAEGDRKVVKTST